MMKTDINAFISHLKAQITQNQLSLDAYKRVAEDFIDFMGDKKEVTQEDINEFQNKQASVFKHNSLINHAGGLRHFLRWCGYDIRRKNEGEHRGFLVKIPKAVATRNTKDDYLTEGEIQRIYYEAKNNPFENAIVRIFFENWQRISTIIALDIPDVDFENKTITYRKMKRGEKRLKLHVVPIEDETVEAIKKYIGTRTEGALFLNRTIPTRLNDDQFRKQLADIGIRANIPRSKRIIPHTARRSGITNAKKNGMQDTDIMKISGHDDINSLKSYDCTDVEDVRKIKEKFTKKYDVSISPPPTPEESMKQELAEAKAEIERLRKLNMPIRHI
jgi:integrase